MRVVVCAHQGIHITTPSLAPVQLFPIHGFVLTTGKMVLPTLVSVINDLSCHFLLYSKGF